MNKRETERALRKRMKAWLREHPEDKDRLAGWSFTFDRPIYREEAA